MREEYTATMLEMLQKKADDVLNKQMQKIFNMSYESKSNPNVVNTTAERVIERKLLK